MSYNRRRSKRARALVQQEDNINAQDVAEGQMDIIDNDEKKKTKKTNLLKHKEEFLRKMKHYRLTNISNQRVEIKNVLRISKLSLSMGVRG